MNKYKIIVAYDGTDYFGWQRQNNRKTVVGTLESTFLRVFNKKISITGASRTDAGVHAYGQVATFFTDLPLNSKKILQAWKNILPADIDIRKLTKITNEFHPQKNVLRKTYYYHFSLKRPSPFYQRYCLFYKYPIILSKLKKSLKIFVGEHDFRSFCTGDDMVSTIRTIDNITVKYLKEFDAYRIIFKGQGFLRYMIRRIVGACLDVSSRKNIKINYLKTILEKKNPKHNLPKTLAKGLLLYKIEYKK